MVSVPNSNRYTIHQSILLSCQCTQIILYKKEGEKGDFPPPHKTICPCSLYLIGVGGKCMILCPRHQLCSADQYYSYFSQPELLLNVLHITFQTERRTGLVSLAF